LGTLGAIVLVVLLAGVQYELLFSTSPLDDGGIGHALWRLLSHREQPAYPPDQSYQVLGPIAKAMTSDLPADVRKRAEPVIDWLTRIDGIQRAELVQIHPRKDELSIDMVGIDEIGCQRIFAATRAEQSPIDLIAVTASDADFLRVPTGTSDDKQCEKRTAFLRMTSKLHASDK
jgi:hypothetical protein